MNTKPHTHDPVVKKLSSDVRYRLVYGDTTVRFWRKKSVEKALRKAVKLHDRGSRVAARPSELTAIVQSQICETKDIWGEDLLTSKAEFPEPLVAKTADELRDEQEETRKKIRERQWKQEQEADRYRQRLINEVRLEFWKEGRPEQKVKVDEYGYVVQPSYNNLVEIVQSPPISGS